MSDKTNNKQQNQAGQKQPTQQKTLQSRTSSLAEQNNRKPSVDELCDGKFKSRPNDVATFINVYCDEVDLQFGLVEIDKYKKNVEAKLSGTQLFKGIRIKRGTDKMFLLFIEHPVKDMWCMHSIVDGKFSSKITTALEAMASIKQHFHL